MQNVEACSSSVGQLRNLVPSTSSPRKRQKRGPEASTVKVKFYHLPEGSPIPKLTKNRYGDFQDLFIEHKDSGYGIYFTIILISIWLYCIAIKMSIDLTF